MFGENAPQPLDMAADDFQILFHQFRQVPHKDRQNMVQEVLFILEIEIDRAASDTGSVCVFRTKVTDVSGRT